MLLDKVFQKIVQNYYLPYFFSNVKMKNNIIAILYIYNIFNYLYRLVFKYFKTKKI